MPNTHVPAAGEASPATEVMQIGRFSRRRLLNLTGAGLAFAAAAMASTVKPAPAALVSKMAELEAAFQAEWSKLRAMEPEHGAAERRYFDECAKLVKPVRRERTQEEIEAFSNLTIAELRDWKSPDAGEYDEASRVYNKADWTIRRRTGFTKIDRGYERQLGRTNKAADRVMFSAAETLDDLAAKTRVHRVWEFDGHDNFEYIMADIARIVGKGGAS